jgi:hypothetical protein
MQGISVNKKNKENVHMKYYQNVVVGNVALVVVTVATASQGYDCGVYGAESYSSSCVDTTTGTGSSTGSQAAETPVGQNTNATPQDTTGSNTNTTTTTSGETSTSTGQTANAGSTGAVGAGDVLTWIGSSCPCGRFVVDGGKDEEEARRDIGVAGAQSTDLGNCAVNTTASQAVVLLS